MFIINTFYKYVLYKSLLCLTMYYLDHNLIITLTLSPNNKIYSKFKNIKVKVKIENVTILS